MDCIPEGLKRCACCHDVKPFSEFYASKSRKDGRFQYCRPCACQKRIEYYHKNPELEIARRIAYAKAHPEQTKASHTRYMHLHWAERWKRYHADKQLQAKFGLHLEDFEAMVETQKGCCALCGYPKKLCIDHSHVSGKIRGLLCIGCNVGLGQLVGDDPAKLDQIRDYLLRGV